MYGYALDIAVQGGCPALVPAASYYADGRKIVIWDKSGLMDVSGAFRSCLKASGGQSFEAMRRLTIKMLSAAGCAWDWLIPSCCLDTAPDQICFAPETGQVLYCVRPSEELDCINTVITEEGSVLILDAAMDIALEYAPSFSRSLQRIKKEALERRSASRHIIRRLELIPLG